MKGILRGMRVVEAAAFVAAPLGGMTLAQLGAEVIRIDPPHGGLDYRRWPVTADNDSLFWRGLNKGKRSVCIDFTKPEGRELAMALITAPGPDAGFLITNFPPRGWLSYEALAAKRSDLIQLTIQGDRHGGSAVDYTVNAKMGVPFLTGLGAEEVPVNHVLPSWDLVTGQMAATGILAAERHRRLTGQGQHIKLALEDVALATMGNLGFIAEAQLGTVRPRYGNDLFGAFGRDFPTADHERVMVIGLTGKQWRSLCQALQMDAEVAELQRSAGLDFEKEGDRFRGRALLTALVEKKIAAQSLAEIARAFEMHGVCWSRYQTVRQLVTRDPACSESNPLFSTVTQPGVGPLLTPTIPLDFAAGGRLEPLPAPELGQHTDDVLGTLLNLGATELGRLHERGIIAGPNR